MVSSIVSLGSIWLAASSILLLVQFAECGEYGVLKCNNGSWSPDGKLIGNGLSCPLPLDGKAKSKIASMQCAMKKAKVFDGKEVVKDKIATEVCSLFTQEELSKPCKETVAECLKDGKDYFADPKTDTELKTWIPFYQCIEKWCKGACKK